MENHRRQIHQERWALLEEINGLTERPMVVLSFAWLALVIIDLAGGLNRSLEIASYIIWLLFILDFLVELIIAPRRLDYLKRNWITAIAILVPAFRILRIFRAFKILQLARFSRSVSLLRIITSLRRGISATRIVLGKRGIGYVILLTILVMFSGAAGMTAFENTPALQEAGHVGVKGIDGYGDALWWSAMVMTTMGSEYWPKTLEGRILGWLMAVYAFAVFGYITATIASLFIQADSGKEI